MATGLTGASPQQPRANDGQNNAGDASQQNAKANPAAAARASENNVEAPQLTEPCAPGEDHRDSDLCAQWKAADAARDAAFWTAGAFWAALAGICVGGLTLAALVITIRQSRDNIRIAQQALALAHAENRPWIIASVEVTGPAVVHEANVRIPLKLTLENKGHFPATNVCHAQAVRAFTWGYQDFKPLWAQVNRTLKSQNEVKHYATIFPGRPLSYDITASEALSRLPDGELMFRLCGSSVYAWGGNLAGSVVYNVSIRAAKDTVKLTRANLEAGQVPLRVFLHDADEHYT